MQGVLEAHAGEDVSKIKGYLKAEAVEIWQEDIRVCKKIGEYGLTLVKPGDGILTHCNAGQLATSKYGTATAPIYLGEEKGYHFKVFADETRPLLQGARLTAFELQSSGVDVTLICDNMSATVMKMAGSMRYLSAVTVWRQTVIRQIRSEPPWLLQWQNIITSRFISVRRPQRLI